MKQDDDDSSEKSKNTDIEAQSPIEEDVNTPEEILSKVPEAMNSTIRETIGMFASGPMQNPLSKNVTPEHISQMIKNDAQDNERIFTYQSVGRKYTLTYVIIAVLVFFGITYMFSGSNPALYTTILSHFSAILGGFGAGWGFSKLPKN